MAMAIEQAKSLEHIAISENKICSEAAIVLARASQKSRSNIKKLNLKNNDMDDSALLALSELVLDKPSLVEIDCTENRIDAAMITNLCEANKTNAHFQVHCWCEKVAVLSNHKLMADQDAQQELVERCMKKAFQQASSMVGFDAAESEDSRGRTLLAIAEGVDKASYLAALIRKKTFFLRNYKIDRGPFAHKSSTCAVVFADDHTTIDGVDGASRVALKFMKNKEQFDRELTSRKELSDDDITSRSVVGVIRGHSADNEAAFVNSTKEYRQGDFAEFKFLLVMPLGDRNLLDAINAEHFAGEDMDQVRSIMKKLGEALLFMEENQLVHGDFKPKVGILIYQ
jgi:hypothetical protein